MENQNFNNPGQQPPQGGFYQQPTLPNSTGVLVLGILSIVFCSSIFILYIIFIKKRRDVFRRCLWFRSALLAIEWLTQSFFVQNPHSRFV